MDSDISLPHELAADGEREQGGLNRTENCIEKHNGLRGSRRRWRLCPTVSILLVVLGAMPQIGAQPQNLLAASRKVTDLPHIGRHSRKILRRSLTTSALSRKLSKAASVLTTGIFSVVACASRKMGWLSYGSWSNALTDRF